MKIRRPLGLYVHIPVLQIQMRLLRFLLSAPL